MPAVQKQFEDFHSKIKLDENDEKAKLREKRDILLDALKAKLPDDVPSFSEFHQGSYAMHTGVRPLDGNYDIDIGLIFDCAAGQYSDPVELKRKVRDALDSNGRTVLIRRPCVTVNYVRGEVVDYHVDLAIYTKRNDGLLLLAKGKENSSPAHRVWELSDPKELTRKVSSAFTDAQDLAQYRRCIRYIKRWRNFQFSNGGAPLSIALTVAAMNWFQPDFYDGKPRDLVALRNWASLMLACFSNVVSSGGAWASRLAVQLPVQPFGDLMAGMTDQQMDVFKEKLTKLRDVLDEANADALPETACERLRKQFGSDFEVPEKAATARTSVASVVGTGISA